MWSHNLGNLKTSFLIRGWRIKKKEDTCIKRVKSPVYIVTCLLQDLGSKVNFLEACHLRAIADFFSFLVSFKMTVADMTWGSRFWSPIWPLIQRLSILLQSCNITEIRWNTQFSCFSKNLRVRGFVISWIWLYSQDCHMRPFKGP